MSLRVRFPPEVLERKFAMTYPWGDERRFNSYSRHFKRTFGERVQKVTIDAGFTCPNRDGTSGIGGCTYCDNNSFNPSYCFPHKSILAQIEEGIEFHARRYRRADKYLAYFQAYSNTYAHLSHLEKLYSEALSHPLIAGLVIGTRPDCIDAEKLDYLVSLSKAPKKPYVAIEYGLESCYDKTLLRINRGHDFECSRKAVEDTAAKGLNVGVHLIFGLPGESKPEMLDEIAVLSSLPVDSVKFHQLQLLRNTRITKEYFENPSDFHLFEPHEYIDFITDVVERLRPDITVERIAGEVPPRFLALSAQWPRNDTMLTLFEKNLEKRNTWQGRITNSQPAVNVD